jgi:putative restriction endonuclease
MAAAPVQQIVDAILEAIHESGFVGGVTSTNIRSNPRKFSMVGPENEVIDLWAYVWTLTHGGRPNLPTEYRIQMTSVTSPLPANPTPVPVGHTILIGYFPDLQVFAGFDFQRHRTFTEGSPSVQIDLTTLSQAVQDGLALERKENNDTVIAIRPDQFVAYVRNAGQLHRTGTDTRFFRLVSRAATSATLPEPQVTQLDEDTARLGGPRRVIVEEVRRLARAANFREKVLSAYGNRCAVTGIQLRLVDAAHILPVGAPGSVDSVQNGIALAPTHHRALDTGLIYLDESLVMQLNPAKVAALRTLQLVERIDTFRATVGRQIRLPQDQTQWPTRQFIRQANRFRQIA